VALEAGRRARAPVDEARRAALREALALLRRIAAVDPDSDASPARPGERA
jgi:hypothetical protein